jgi:putative redox protein
MSVKMSGRYIGNKKVELTHLDSGAKIITSAPKDNNGDGASFSPTDMLTASLGACMLTIVGIVAERDHINIDGSYFNVEKIMSSTSPRKVANINLVMHLPSHLSEEIRVKYERAAATCPVHHSLHPDTHVEIMFTYDV